MGPDLATDPTNRSIIGCTGVHHTLVLTNYQQMFLLAYLLSKHQNLFISIEDCIDRVIVLLVWMMISQALVHHHVMIRVLHIEWPVMA